MNETEQVFEPLPDYIEGDMTEKVSNPVAPEAPEAREPHSQHTRDTKDSPPPCAPEGATFIPLTRSRFAIVDEEWWWKLSQNKWQYSEDRSGYGVATRWRKGGGKLQMHRVVAGCQDPDMKVDHINGNSLDNRTVNLRICTHRQNAHNVAKRRDGVTSRYKGVWIHKRSRKWESQITVDGRTQHLGMFPSEVMAALAYNFAALLWYEEFAFLNVIPGYTDTRGYPLTHELCNPEAMAVEMAFAKGGPALGVVLENETRTERPAAYK